ETGGNDTVHGGGGADTVYMGGSFNASDHIDGGGGFDAVEIGGMDGVDALFFTATTMTNVELLILDDTSSYTLKLTDETVADGEIFIVAGSALGAGHALSIDASADTDGQVYVTGGAGNDIVHGNSGPGGMGVTFDLGGSDTYYSGGSDAGISFGA